MSEKKDKPEWKISRALGLHCGPFLVRVAPASGTAWEWQVEFLDDGFVSVTDSRFATPEDAQRDAVEWLTMNLQLALDDLGRDSFEHADASVLDAPDPPTGSTPSPA